MSKQDLSKIGFPAWDSIDNNCGEFLNKGLFFKIKKLECYQLDNHILAIFPFYEVEEYDNKIYQSKFYREFEDLKGNKDFLPEIKQETITFDDDECLKSIEVGYNKNIFDKKHEISALNFNTDKRSFVIGMKKIFEKGNSDFLKNFEIEKLYIKEQFIIGLNLGFQFEKQNGYKIKIPHLSFVKIYTHKLNKKNKFSRFLFSLIKVSSYVLSILVLVLSLIFAYYYSSQNILKGVLIVESNNNLDHQSKIHTDENGFVHIKAESIEDAFFTLGIAHARDRLFQMDFLRRLSTGRLSEVLGAKALKIDKLMREIGINRVVEEDYLHLIDNNREDYDGAIVEKIRRYVNGVNYYASKNYLPPEYFILNFKFEKWTAYDSLACARFQAFTLSLDWPLEIFNKIFEETFGKEFFESLMDVSYSNFYLSDKTVLTKEDLEKLNLAKNFIEKTQLNADDKLKDNYNKISSHNDIKFVADVESTERKVLANDLITGQASNSWAISGKFTNSGKPIFSNDPHLKNLIPGMHYIVKLYIGNSTSESIIVGSAPAGMPMILIGSNDNISWGFTTDNRDIADICEEKTDADSINDSKFYFVGEERHELKEVKEVIKIKGKENFELTVKSTRNGPLIDEFIKEIGFLGLDYKYKSARVNDKNKPNAISLRSVSFQFHDVIPFFHSLMSAKSKEDFLPKLEKFPAPLLALVWATTEGEIGYTPIGKIPIKKNNQSKFCKGYIPDDLSYDIITGFIPRKETPVMINPEKGYIVTANNRQLPENYIHDIQSYAYFYRFQRISDLIDDIINKQDKKFDLNDNKNILFDVLDLNCEYVLPKLVNIVERNWELIELNNGKESIKLDKTRNYLKIFKEFDCNFYKNSTAATLYSVYEYHLGLKLLLKNEENGVKGFQNELEARAFLNNFNYWNFIQKLIETVEEKKEINMRVVGNCRYYKQSDTCEGYIVSTFERLYEFLSTGYKNEDDNVKPWGEVHFHYYPHVFDSIPVLKKIFSRKIATGGNRYTVKVSKNKFDDNINGPFTSNHSANLKFISDLSDINCPYVIIDTGNMGNVLSKFYDNLIEKSEKNEFIKIKNHAFNNDNSLTISFPEHNTLIIRNK